MRRTRRFALILSLIMGISTLTGCGSLQKEGETLNLSMDNSWATEQYLKNFRYSIKYTQGKYLFCAERNNATQEYHYCRFDMETGEMLEFESPFEHSVEYTAPERLESIVTELPDGRFAIRHKVVQGVGGGATETHRQVLEIFDENMNAVELVEIPTKFGELDIEEQQDRMYYGTMDGKGNWVFYNYNSHEGELTLESFDSEYHYLGDISFTLPQREHFTTPAIFQDADGNLCMSILCGSFGESYEKIYRLDAEKRTCEDTGVIIAEEENDTASGYIAGTNGYEYYYCTNSGLYGVKGKEKVKVIDWVNSDFLPGTIRSCLPLDDGRFILYKERDSYLAQPRSQEEIDSTTIISLATVTYSEDMLKAIMDYNREESGYRIMVKDYSEYNTVEEPNLGYDTMKQDMLDGKVADIICPDGVNFESLAGKGLFADWYDFMDKDEEFSRDKYLQNYFETMETDDKLLRLGFSYVIETGTAKTELAGEEQGISLGDMLALSQETGIDMFDLSPQMDFAGMWMRNLQTGCIDRKNAVCCFNSPQMVEFLEFVSTLEADWDAMELARESGKYTSGKTGYPYRENCILFNIEPIKQPIDIRAIRRYTFYDADITLTGYPMVEDAGNGGIFSPVFTICINAQSTEQEAVWDFMKFFLTEDYQKHLTESMPIHKNALEYKYEEAESMVTATAGGMISPTFIGELESWESDILRDYISGIRTCAYYDYTVQDILMEEVEKFLAGDQTAQECADMMQSRVTIYLSEQS
ncbi:MAG: carbohydrate ABC transporter substrate-binding protein [Ruminococcus sp.]|nr:carbohydrate ABC transporter substrate-binding protein [Ruminococcus sp.]